MTTPRSLFDGLRQVRSRLRADPATAHSPHLFPAILALKWAADQRTAGNLSGFFAYAPEWNEIRTAESPGKALAAAFARLELAHPGEEKWFDTLNFSTCQDQLWAEVVERVSPLSFCDVDPRNQIRLKFRMLRMIHHATLKDRDFLVPPTLARLLTGLLAPPDGASVFDPFCQDGTLLLEVASYCRKNRESGVTLYAQTPDDHGRLVTALNLLVHNCPDVHIATGDPILAPGFVQDERRLTTFDRVVGNVPAGTADWGSEALQHDPYVRFVYGVPPRTSRDYAYLIHAIASLADGGRLVAVVPMGVLFRSARTEKEIRANIVNSDRVEAVIALPPRLFAATATEWAVIVLVAGKAAERQGRTIFIDASGLFQSKRGSIDGPVAHPVSPRKWETDIENILDAYTAFKEVEGLSAVATTDEIAENDFTLEVSRYVSQVQEKVERIDLDATMAELGEVRRKKEEALDRFVASVARLKKKQR